MVVVDNLSELNFHSEAQLLPEHLEMGDSTWACVAELEAEHDMKHFYGCYKSEEMLKCFSFRDTLLEELEIIHPERISTFSQLWLV